MNKRWIYLLLPGIVLVLGCLTGPCYADPAPVANPAPAADPAPVATPATAATPATVANAKETVAKKWSLEECIYAALHHHGDVLASEQSVRAAKAAVTQAKGAYFPSITLQSMPLTFAGETMGNSVMMNGTSMTVTQNVFDSGITASNVKDKVYAAKSSESTLVRQQQTTANNVISSYYSAWLAMRQADLQETTVKDLEGQLDMINTRVQVGDAAKSDALPVEASLANAQVAMLTAKNTIRTQLVALQDAMGMEPGGEFDIQDVEAPKKVLLDSLDKYQVLAVKSRPDLLANQAQITAAKAEEQSAKINTLPHVAINGSYVNSVDHLSLNNWGISGGLVYNLFDGQQAHAQLQQAQAAVKTAQINAVQLAKDIETQVQQAYLNLTSAQENLAAVELGLKASETNYEVQEAEYKEGLATPQNVLDAQVQVATAKSNQVQAQYNYLTARAALEYATGKQGGLDGK